MIRVTGKWVVALAMVAVLAGCGNSEHAQPTGGTLVIAAQAEPDNLLPPLTITAQGRQVADQVFDFLADMGPSLNTIGDAGFTPRLADRWTWAPDSMSIAFHIDPRARWHDGMPVRAGDVAFTYRLVTDSTLGSPVAPTIANVDSVTVRDSLTAVVWFRHRTPEQFFDFAYNVAILPAHALRDVPPKSLASSAFARHPIGSGRFRFAKWEPGARVELVADSANYRGRAKLDRVVWTVSPDPAAALTRVLAGDADFLEVVRGPAMKQVESAPKLRLLVGPSLDYVYLGFNMQRPVFASADVRRALSAAVDRATLARSVFDTLAAPGIGPLTRAVPTADASVAGAPYDSAAAARVLAAHPVAFRLLVPTSSAPRMRYATLLQEQYRRFGVTVTIEPVEMNVFAQRITKGDYDAVLNGWHTDPSPAAVRQAWSASAIPPAGANFARYTSPVFDALVDSAAMQFDPARATAYYRRAYRVIAADAPAVWLYEPKAASAVNRRVTVAGIRPDSWWAGLADWTVAPRS